MNAAGPPRDAAGRRSRSEWAPSIEIEMCVALVLWSLFLACCELASADCNATAAGTLPHVLWGSRAGRFRRSGDLAVFQGLPRGKGKGADDE